MTFFFDNNFAPSYVQAFKVLGEDVCHLRESFDPATPDEDWLPVIGQREWTLVTCDIRIARNPQQRVVLEKAGIVSFMCAAGVVKLKRWEQFTWLVRAWPNICKEAAKARNATTFRVTMNHKVEPWKSKK